MMDVSSTYSVPNITAYSSSNNLHSSMPRTMQEIIPGVFLGPYLAALGNCRDILLHNGITHIVCVRQLGEAHFIKPHFNDTTFTYLILDISDMATENIIRFFPRVKQFIDDALAKDSKVLIHGNSGNSRSATLVLAYIMEKLGLSCKDAYTLVKERRECIKPNEGFVAQLVEYEPIYKARQTQAQGQSSTDKQRCKRKSEHLTELVDIELIQPPSSPVNENCEEVSIQELGYYFNQDTVI